MYKSRPTINLTRLIELEGLMSSINGHRHWTNCSHSLHQSMLFTTWDVHKASVISCTIGGIVVAGLVILNTEYADKLTLLLQQL